MIYREEIDRETLNNLPLLRYEGKVEVIEKRKDVKLAVKELTKSPFVGFDTETKPNFKKGSMNPVALLQLATKEKAFIFRLTEVQLPDELIWFLEGSTTKIGVAIHDDLKDLMRFYRKFTPGGFLDLADLVEEVGIKNRGLRKLAGIILGGKISKSQQLSNWENGTLTKAQIAYAATDAWVCWRMYKELMNKGLVA